MYSCEKLAKGNPNRFDSNERISSEYLRIQRNKLLSKANSKYEYNFADARKYHVNISLYEERPRGLIYRTRKK